MTDSNQRTASLNRPSDWELHYQENRSKTMLKRAKTSALVASASTLVGVLVVTLVDPALTGEAPVMLSALGLLGAGLFTLLLNSPSIKVNVFMQALLTLAIVLHVEVILLVHVGHEPPKLLLTIIPAVLAMVIPLERNEYLPIALIVPIVHLSFSPLTGSEYIVIEIFMIMVSTSFGWLNVEQSTQDRKLLSQNAITIQREQEQLKENNRTLEVRVTERTRIAEHRAQELQKLAQEVNRAESRERQLIARTLHDNLQQVIAAARLRLGTIKSESSDKLGENERECLITAQNLLNEALETSRTLAVELAPYSLLEEGLPVAISWLSNHFQERHQLQLTTDIDADADGIQPEVNYFLFHSTRELLFNATKHSPTNSAHLTVRSSAPDNISVSVKNKMKAPCAGEFPNSVETFQPTFGLPTIQTRARLMGGTALIENEEEGFFKVTITLPRFVELAVKSQVLTSSDRSSVPSIPKPSTMTP